MTRLNRIRRPAARQRGAAAILAMMFLVIFASLAAAMSIVAQGNLATADAHLKINRSMAAAETGMRFVSYRLALVASVVQTRDGVIDDSNAPALWDTTRGLLRDSFTGELHNLAEPVEVGSTLTVGPIAVAPGAPAFTATFQPHPLPAEDYTGAYYRRPAYQEIWEPFVENYHGAEFDTLTPTQVEAALATWELDATWIRVTVDAADGPNGMQVSRTIAMDFRITKRIPFAILSKSRVMIGRNVMIDGPIGSRYAENYLPNGHPIQIESDFAGLDGSPGGLDEKLNDLAAVLHTNDVDMDNRIDLSDPSETVDITDAENFDLNGDGFIDDYDYFLGHYDVNADGAVTAIELDTASSINRAQLLELIDTFGDPGRPGYNDGQIDADDRYAKIRGEIMLTTSWTAWNDGAAATHYGGTGMIQDYYRGAIVPDHNQAPITFESDDADVHQYGPSDFDMTTFRDKATGDFGAQAAAQAAAHDPEDPDSPGALGTTQREEVPFGSPHPYDHYDRPVYENMTFENVRIPKGTNALFKNCKFIGVTFVETETDNTDPNFNYAGIEEADGTPKHPDATVIVDGSEMPSSKTVSNNIRFDDCEFEGAVVSDSPQEFTQVRNKISFTGTTRFNIEDSANLTDAEKALYGRSTILTPHYSVEMGTFVAPHDATETVQLTGTIVAGILDMRGQVKVTGTVLTTFEPTSGSGPVLGDTSPQFNTTLGYFSSDAGDLEAELPANGLGVIQVVYDPTIPLPDGILGPIQIDPRRTTYTEAGP